MKKTITQRVFNGRARDFSAMRVVIMQQLYPNGRFFTGDQSPNSVELMLNDFISSFSRYAGNQQTAFDNGVGRSAGIGSSSGTTLERQVERAITQVLGRAPGRGGDSFVNALVDVFPTGSDGRQVTFTPSRNAVSLYTANTNGLTPNGFNGQLSTKQATLYRQASVVATDALSALASLTTFMPEADVEQVEALRALVRTEIRSLVDEFSRVDEPRPARVEGYLNALGLHLTEFGRKALLDDPRLATTISDEAQTAGFSLLRKYETILNNVWRDYIDTERPRATYSLSERIERANILLPIIAQSNTDFEDALDSVGFTESERHSLNSKFTRLDERKLTAQNVTGSPARLVDIGALDQDEINQLFNPGTYLPDITVSDLTDWLDRFATIEGPSILADSGQYGMEFVTEQADRLFWTIAPVVQYVKQPVSQSWLNQMLSNERVVRALDNMLSQIYELANLDLPRRDLKQIETTTQA